MTTNAFLKPGMPAPRGRFQLIPNPSPPHTASLQPSTIPPPMPALPPVPSTKYLGEGTYGTVERVVNPIGIAVARKTFRLRDYQICLDEFKVLKRARDRKAPNVIWAAHRWDVPSSSSATADEQPIVRKSEDGVYFEMELADWGNLHQFLQNTPRLYIGEQLIKWIGVQSLAGLVWLHERRILHGDIKTLNLLVFKGPHAPHIKLGDLGSCTQLDADGKDTTGMIRSCLTTFSYAAPEMLLAKPLTAPTASNGITLGADVYSLGILLMEISGHQHPCYTVQPPTPQQSSTSHHANMEAVHAKRPKILEVYKPHFQISTEMQSFFASATAFDLGDRATAPQLLKDSLLDDVRQGYRYEAMASPYDVLELEQEKASLMLENEKLRARLESIEQSRQELQSIRSLAQSFVVVEMNRTPSPIRTIFAIEEFIALQPLPIENISLHSPIPALYHHRIIHEPSPGETLNDSGLIPTPTELTPSQFLKTIPLFSPIISEKKIFFHPGPPPPEAPVVIEEEEELVPFKREVIEIEDDENLDPLPPAKRARLDVHQIHSPPPPLALHWSPPPAPVQQQRREMARPGNWELANYQVPANAQESYEERLHANRLNLEPITCMGLFTFAADMRQLFSHHYQNGNGLNMGRENLLHLLRDPMGFKEKLQRPKGSEYSLLEKGFIIACLEICGCSKGARMLASLVFNERTHDSILDRIKRL